MFEPYTQRGTAIVLEIQPEWLDLAFADAAKIEEVVDAALAIEPNIGRADFRRFIEGRARIVQNIAAFLVAHMTFAEGEDAAERIAELAANTLATVRVSSDLLTMMKSAETMLQEVLSLQTPELHPFENLDLQREFEAVTMRLQQAA